MYGIDCSDNCKQNNTCQVSWCSDITHRRWLFHMYCIIGKGEQSTPLITTHICRVNHWAWSRSDLTFSGQCGKSDMCGVIVGVAPDWKCLDKGAIVWRLWSGIVLKNLKNTNLTTNVLMFLQNHYFALLLQGQQRLLSSGYLIFGSAG